VLAHRFFLLLFFLLCLPMSASAHSVPPSFLQITLQTDGYYDMVWKVPTRGKDALAISPKLPKHCQDYVAPRNQAVTNAMLTHRRLDCGQIGLSGQSISIEGIEGSIANVLVRIVLNNQQTQTLILQATRPSFMVTGDLSWQQVTVDYAKLGIEHILLGIDHLLFVFGLLLLVRNRWSLIKTITAFTIAHSITLAASALGWVKVAQGPVEAVIALSILFLALELAKQYPKPSLTQRAPWIVAFVFGLLHGFGFAGVLREIGLPPSDVPLALLTFNVGVELGQLLFVSIVLLAWTAIRRLWKAQPTWLMPSGVYIMGSLSAFWLITRTIPLF
jgi:hydrogenase/urease accessory protein HupE